MQPRLTAELRDEIKAAIVAKVLTDGKDALKDIEGLYEWIEKKAGELNIWCEGASTAKQDINSALAYEISEKFDEVANIFTGLSAEQYFKEATERLYKEFHAELLDLEVIYLPDIQNLFSDSISATFPYLAKYIYGYRHLAWQIYCVSKDYYSH